MIPGHDVLLGLEARRTEIDARPSTRLELDSFRRERRPPGYYDKIAFYAPGPVRRHQGTALRIVARRPPFTGPEDEAVSNRRPRRDWPSSLHAHRTACVLRRRIQHRPFDFPTFSELYQASWFFTVSIRESAFLPFPFLRLQAESESEAGRDQHLRRRRPSISLSPDRVGQGRICIARRLKNFIVHRAALRAAGPSPSLARMGEPARPNARRIHPAGRWLDALARQTSPTGVTGFVNWGRISRNRR